MGCRNLFFFIFVSHCKVKSHVQIENGQQIVVCAFAFHFIICMNRTTHVLLIWIRHQSSTAIHHESLIDFYYIAYEKLRKSQCYSCENHIYIYGIEAQIQFVFVFFFCFLFLLICLFLLSSHHYSLLCVSIIEFDFNFEMCNSCSSGSGSLSLSLSCRLCLN